MIAPDARGRSLGEGGSVFSRGAISAYYNPALLVTSETVSGGFNYCDYAPEFSDDISVINVFIAHKFRDLGYYGIGFTKFDYGNTYGPGKSYDYSLGFWAAMDFDRDYSIGIGVKYIKMKLEFYNYWTGSRSYEGSSYAFDFGFLSRNHLPKSTYKVDSKGKIPGMFSEERDEGFSFGISLANLGKGIAFFDPDQTDPLPRKLRLAAGYQAIDSEPVGLRLMVDATKLLIDVEDSFRKEWSEIVWSYGLESTFYYIVHFRLGRLFDRDTYQRFNIIGAGIGPDWLRLDYSRILGDEDDRGWNRRYGEASISLICNISPDTFR